MFSSELRKLLAEVITSWQVLTVTGVLIIYVFIINYVARMHRRSPRISLPKVKQKTPEAPAPPSESEELGLEETKAPKK